MKPKKKYNKVLYFQKNILSLEWIVGIDPPAIRGNPISSSTSFDRGQLKTGKMKEIPLTRGMVAKVDDEDYYWLMLWKWHAASVGNNRFYARKTKYIDGKKIDYSMSRLIAQTPPHLECDHINHDTLDNRRANLRNCTRGENARNNSPYGSSKYKGVCRPTGRRKFGARLRLNGKYLHLGTYFNEWAAAIAYDKAAKLNHLDCANLNFK